MRTLVFGDIHGNLPAFEAMLGHAGLVDRYVCLGDVVNYGPWSDECVDLLESLPNCDKVAGNHDIAFLKGKYDGTHPLVRTFFEFCHPRFHRFEALARYLPHTTIGKFRVQHTLEDRYVYADSPIRLDGNYIIGHSHQQFRREADGFELFNAGSIGQNRTHLNVINYLLCGPETQEIEMKAFTYDPDPVIMAMRRRGYPAACIAYYEGKPRL